MAQLDDPFSHRPSALAAAGLDEARLRNLIDSWRMRLEGDTHGELGERFTKAYSARSAALHAARQRTMVGADDPTDPRFLTKEALGFREEAALVGRPPSAESATPPAPAPIQDHVPTTAPPRAEPSGVLVAPRPTSEPPPAPAPSYYPPAPAPAYCTPVPAPAPAQYAPAPSAQPSYLRPAERLAGTADISSVVAKLALPFARSAESAPAHQASFPAASPRIDSGTADTSSVVRGLGIPFPGSASNPPPAHLAPPPLPAKRPQRLIRFDPQTGHPLQAPIWVDVPEDPKK